MLNTTNIFINEDKASGSYVDSIFSKVQKVYKVDDCDITISTAKADVHDCLSPLIGKIGNEGVLQVIKNFRGTLNCNIPVMTFEEYLKEIKDCIQSDKEGNIDLRVLSRILLPVNANTVVANVIIVGKEEYKGEPILLNELFINDKYVKTVEYKISDLQQKLDSLNNPTNIIDQHKMYNK